ESDWHHRHRPYRDWDRLACLGRFYVHQTGESGRAGSDPGYCGEGAYDSVSASAGGDLSGWRHRAANCEQPGRVAGRLQVARGKKASIGEAELEFPNSVASF